MSNDLETFLANIEYAARANGAHIGGGDFSADELRAIAAEIRALIEKAENHGQ